MKKTPQTVSPDTLKACLKWILEANDERDIREAIRTTYPDADEQAVLDAAVKEIEAIGNESGDFTRGWALAATRELVRKMIEVGDFANAMRGIKQVAELAGKDA
ncbi:MAG: hypothetical protein A2498_00880 [Lentisphaerae bacterium RIFOXYC12_FULL_60_16]|nr:MAG: hypothetical protein A2498_00880 [Lentisphaerae bacterium RIFOXYC12_FULL_60_16]